MSPWTQTLLLASRDAAILSLLIGGLLFLISKQIPAGWRHALWLLVAIRLLMPALPSSPLSWQSILEKEATSMTQEVLPARSQPMAVLQQMPQAPPWAEAQDATVKSAPIPPRVEVTHPLTKWDVFSLIWASGALGLLTLGAVLTRRFSRKCRKLTVSSHPGKPDLEALLATLGEEAGWRKMPSITITEAVEVPALFGIFRPQILISPAALEKLTKSELRLVLLHELGHWRRRDLWTHLAMSILQAIHWFNPFVWWAFHRTRVESERATDAWVLHRAGASHVPQYGGMLLRLLDQSTKPQRIFSSLVSVVESPKDLHRRIAGIGRFTGKRNRMAVLVSIATLLGLAAVGLTQPPTVEMEQKSSAQKAVPTDSLGKIHHIRVLSLDQNPVADAEVYFDFMSNLDGEIIQPVQFLGKTDRSGEISLSIPEKWQSNFVTVQLFSRHSREGYGGLTFRAAGKKTTYELAISKGDSLHLRALDEQGQPIANLKVHLGEVYRDDFLDHLNEPIFLGSVSPLPEGFWNATTDSEGRCMLKGLPLGRYYVDCDDPRFGRNGSYDFSFRYSPNEQGQEVILNLKPATTVSGFVRLPDGTPVGGAKVEVLERATYRHGGVHATTTTDQKGYYKLERLLPGDYNIRAELNPLYDEDWTCEASDFVLRPGDHMEQLNPLIMKGGIVSGRVTLADTGAPVPDYFIGLTTEKSFSSIASWSAITDQNGFFHRRIPAGKRRIYPGGPGPEGYTTRTSDDNPLQEDILVEDGSNHQVNFQLLNQGRIHGLTVDETGNPLAGVSVTCSEPLNQLSMRETVISDATGHFSFVLPSGTEKVRLFAEMGDDSCSNTATYPVGGQIKVTMKPNGFATISGQVVDTQGRAVEGVLISCNQDESLYRKLDKVYTDRLGRYKMQKIFPGESVDIYATKEGYGKTDSYQPLTAGETKELKPIILPRADSSVRGTVVAPDGTPLAGASVRVSGEQETDDLEKQTDENGHFLLNAVEGWLTLYAHTDHHEQQLWNQVRVHTDREPVTITLSAGVAARPLKPMMDYLNKPAPPLRAQSWLVGGPLPESGPGKVRLIQFVGLDRPLIYYSDFLTGLEKLRKEIPDPNLEIIVVHGPWPKEEVMEILARDHPNFSIPIALELEEGAMSKAFGAQSWLTVVIDQEGKVVFHDPGKWSDAKKKVRSLLEKK